MTYFAYFQHVFSVSNGPKASTLLPQLIIKKIASTLFMLIPSSGPPAGMRHYKV